MTKTKPKIEYKTKQYTKDDYWFVYDVKKIVYKKYVEQNWGEWNEIEQVKMFKDFMDAHSKEIKIIVVDGVKIGFFHGKNIDKNNYVQRNICILPEYQGKGIGTNILKKTIILHKDQDIHIRCFKQNPVFNFYKRLGFEVVEELPYHYRLVLRKKEK